MEIWSLLAFQLVAVLSGVVTAGLVMVIGGVGGHLALSRRLNVTEDRVEDVDAKIDREIKRRAADAATKSRTEKKTVEGQAAEIIAGAAEGAAPATRPSVANLLR